MAILLSIYGKQYDEILNEGSLDEAYIAEHCGMATAHMIKYIKQPDLQSASWVSSSFYGYKAFNKTSFSIKPRFLRDEEGKFSDIIYKQAAKELKTLEKDKKHRLTYSIYYKDEPKEHYWTNAQLVDPEFIRNFLWVNASDCMNKEWLKYEIDKLIERYK